MLNQLQVQNQLPPQFHPLLPYITQIANVYVAAGMDENYVCILCLGEAAENAVAVTAAAYRDALINECNQYAPPPGADLLVRAVPIPAAPVVAPVAVVPRRPVNYAARHAEEIARLRRLRTPGSQQNGRRLARAALAMRNWFHWVKSGPREPGFAGQEGEDFGPKTAWRATRKDTGIEWHDRKQNDFANWLVNGGNPPDQASFMNCWESVLFSAFQAHLKDRLWLQMIHRKAALAYQLNYRVNQGGGQHYFQALSHAFGFYSSVPFEPRAALIPREGDILFWDRDQHVAISLGRTWDGGQPEDRMMSLWHHNQGTFARLTLEDMPHWMQDSLRFIPCPF